MVRLNDSPDMTIAVYCGGKQQVSGENEFMIHDGHIIKTIYWV